MKKGYKFRIYPNREQQVLLAKTFGCCRFVWNECLRRHNEAYKIHETDSCLKPSASKDALTKKLPTLKQEYPWLEEVSSAALQQQTRDLGSAFVNFFQGRSNYPKFKKKRSLQSFRLPNIFFRINGRSLYLAKCKFPFRVKWSRELPSEPSSVIISQDSAGKYFASFVCEYRPITGDGQKQIGVDLGLTHFATLSTGEKIPNPRYYLRLQRQLGRAQRQLARKVKGSNNCNKARLKVAKIHTRIKDQRNDFMHKLTTRLINENQVISIENLQISNMIRNRRLSKSIADVGWGLFERFLKYKAVESQWTTIMVMDPFFASTHICSVCRTKLNRRLSLSERLWVCPTCGTAHDRDHNAAEIIDYCGYQSHRELNYPRGRVLQADSNVQFS